MFRSMHAVLQQILQQQTRGNFAPFYPTLEAIIRRRHEVEHPGERQVAADQREALGLRQVLLGGLGIIVDPILVRLHGHEPARVLGPRPPQILVAQDKNLAHGHGQQP